MKKIAVFLLFYFLLSLMVFAQDFEIETATPRVKPSLSREDKGLPQIDIEKAQTMTVEERHVQIINFFDANPRLKIVYRYSKVNVPQPVQEEIPIKNLLTFIKTNFDEQETPVFLSYLECFVNGILDVESKLKKFGVQKFPPQAGFYISERISMLNFLSAKASPEWIKATMPDPLKIEKLKAKDLDLCFKVMLAHEYGHFLYFCDHEGNVVIPQEATLTNLQEIIRIDSREMDRYGELRRYHLSHIQMRPFVSQANVVLSVPEYWVLSELIAHKVLAILYEEKGLIAFIQKILVDEYLTRGSAEQVLGKNPSIESLALSLWLMRIAGNEKWDKYFYEELERKLKDKKQIDEILGRLSEFYSAVQLQRYNF